MSQGHYPLGSAGWAASTVGEVFRVVGGGTPSTVEPSYWRGSIPWITSADIDPFGTITIRHTISPEGIESSATNLVPGGSVVVVTRVGLGKVGLALQDLCFSQDCQALIFDDKHLEPGYVSHYVRWVAQGLKYAGRGTTIAGVTKRQLVGLPFLLPPRSEQHRIVVAIEEQLTRLEAAVGALQRAQANLKRYRASVLKAACEGRLVPTEAELARAEGRDYEPASRLLARILGERRGLSGIEKSTGSPGRKVPDNCPQETQKFNRGSRVASGDMSEIPVGWTWTSVAQLASQDANAITDGPFGSNLKTAHYTAHGPRVIRLQNISDGAFVDLHSHISEEHFSRLGRHRVEAGDIVIAALGERLPRACVVPAFLGPAIVKADCVRFKPDFRLVYPTYASLMLNAQPTRTRTQEIIHGVGRPRLNVREIKAIMIPLAPFPEQARIVSEVERRFSVIDELEATVQTNLQRAERLKQSILKRAFEGKLVPQDPKDEPASVLLDRIKAERAAGGDAVGRTRARKPRQNGLRRKARGLSGKLNRGRAAAEPEVPYRTRHRGKRGL